MYLVFHLTDKTTIGKTNFRIIKFDLAVHVLRRRYALAGVPPSVLSPFDVRFLFLAENLGNKRSKIEYGVSDVTQQKTQVTEVLKI